MRRVVTHREQPIPSIIESMTVDYDNRSFDFTVHGHEVPGIITVTLGPYETTLTREALVEGFTRLLEAIEQVEAAK